MCNRDMARRDREAASDVNKGEPAVRDSRRV